MIDLTELRVGNLLTTIKGTKHYKSTFKVENIIYNNDNLDQSLTLLNGYEVNEVIPIPLTEEWLIKFGFEANKSNYLKYSLIKNGFAIEFEVPENGDIEGGFLERIGVEMYYVHQLQNLYHALTGEELEIN